MLDYATSLRQDPDLAIRHIGKFLMKTDPVHETLHRVTKRLSDLQIPHAVCGGMSLTAHGYIRATVDVDILVNADGLKIIHQQLVGLGFLPPFSGSKNLKDTDTGVRVEFLLSGGYPGDGQPKPIAFPNPAEPGVTEEIKGVHYLSLEKLIELKLASGMTAPHRGKDLVDVQALIEVRKLPANYVDNLHPYVQAKFTELWGYAHAPRPDFEERDPD
jgi:hypothetical protein